MPAVISCDLNREQHEKKHAALQVECFNVCYSVCLHMNLSSLVNLWTHLQTGRSRLRSLQRHLEQCHGHHGHLWKELKDG